jgi:radical SAM protein with 4Fe4S-binding SPASM domain
MGVSEVYLQRLVFFDVDPVALARPDQTLFGRLQKDEAAILAEAEAEARRLGITFSASGAASEPGMSLMSMTRENPWSLCGRPWTLMYFTANGRALPCCIAPFAQRGYENYTLGDATSEPLDAIWNGDRYQTFRAALQSDRPPRACGSCGLRWSL